MKAVISGRSRAFRLTLVAILCLMALSGCSSLVDSDQAQAAGDRPATIGEGATAGQTFVARHAGLQGIDFWLAPGSLERDGVLRLTLEESPETRVILATSELPAADIREPGYYHFGFAPFPDSHGRYYYARLESSGAATFRPGSAPPSSYIDGAMHQDDLPVDAQMTFRLAYDPAHIASDLARFALMVFGLLALAIFLYLIPGWGLLAWLAPRGLFGAREQPAIALAISLGIYPLLFFFTAMAGLHLGKFYAILPGAAGILALIWRYGHGNPRELYASLRRWSRSSAVLPDLVLLFVIACLLASRFLPIRNLDAPMLGDSYHHTIITQLMLDNGGLFQSWEPYAPLQSFTYHFGFHSQVAVAAWISGLPAPQAVLFVAQLFNVLAVMVLYSLTFRVSGSRWGAVLAVIVAGLLVRVPMIYVNWGRDTQLAGQVILPGVLLLSWSALGSARRTWGLLVLNWLAIGGLAFTHYRILILYVLFVLAWLLVTLRRQNWRRTLVAVAGIGSGGAALFAPWFLELQGGQILRNAGRQLSTSAASRSVFDLQYNAAGDLTSYLPVVIWLGMLVALGIAFWRRRQAVLVLSVWWLLVLFAANPAWFGLPGTGLINNFTIVIAAYIPAAVLAAEFWMAAPGVWATRSFVNGAIAVAFVLLAGYGLAQRQSDIDPASNALVRRPDIRAMYWIRENTPPESVFLVNATLAYSNSLAVGTDGGWWLAYFTGRKSTAPPITYANEEPTQPGYRDWVRTIGQWIVQNRVTDSEVVSRLKAEGVTHVYLGQAQGRVWSASALDPQALLKSPHFRLLYHRDLTWIFALV